MPAPSATLDDAGNVVFTDPAHGTSSASDYNSLINGLFGLANTALRNTTGQPASQAPAAAPGTLFGYPIKTVLIVVALGVLAIWLGRKILD